MSVQNPIVNAGLLYCNNLDLAWASNTTITMAAGAARDSTNVNDIVLSSSATINGAVIGANGIDVATIAASSMYNVFVIGDSTSNNDTAGLLSLSNTPSLPSGYDMYRNVGSVLSDGSSHFLLFWQSGAGQTRTIYYDVAISELSGGSSTTFAEIDLATSLPDAATQVIFKATFTPDGATEIAEFLPYGSAAASGMITFGYGVAGAQQGMVTVPVRLKSGVPTVQYKVASGDTLSLSTAGFVYSI